MKKLKLWKEMSRGLIDRIDDFIRKSNFPILMLLVVFITMCFIYMFQLDYFNRQFVKVIQFFIFDKSKDSLAKAGTYGDFIGGVLGTIIGLIGAIYVYKTFKYQQENFKKERFESRVFELIKLYRDSVDEMNIQGVRDGRKCFIPMFKEFKALYYLTFAEYIEFIKGNPSFTLKDSNGEVLFTENEIKEELCKIAYKVFFSGIGIESNKLTRLDSNPNSNFLLHLQKKIYQFQIDYTTHQRLKDIDSNYSKKTDKIYINFKNQSYKIEYGNLEDILLLHQEETTKISESDIFIFEPKYYPFDGHITRLGHYYRNLFQIVRFIVSHEEKLLTKEEILEYLKLLRTQMSNHEQLLLFYNAIVGGGDKWRRDDKNGDKDYFTEYYMIHNLPLPHADFGVSIDNIFGIKKERDPELFEWDKF